MTRDVAIPVVPSIVAVLVTSVVRGSPAEVGLGETEGLDAGCVATADTVVTVRKGSLGRYRGRLGPDRMAALETALRLALDL